MRRLLTAVALAAAATAGELHDCGDVKEWNEPGDKVLFDGKHDCTYIEALPDKRCDERGVAPAKEVCRAACGFKDGIDRPSFQVESEAPTYNAEPSLRGRFAGLDAAAVTSLAVNALEKMKKLAKSRTSRTCAWVAQDPKARCEERGTVLAHDACHAACFSTELKHLKKEQWSAKQPLVAP